MAGRRKHLTLTPEAAFHIQTLPTKQQLSFNHDIDLFLTFISTFTALMYIEYFYRQTNYMFCCLKS